MLKACFGPFDSLQTCSMQRISLLVRIGCCAAAHNIGESAYTDGASAFTVSAAAYSVGAAAYTVGAAA